MDIDELRTVQTKERQKDSLQHLRESFYEDVADYIADLKAQREHAAEQADDPFSSPEVSRLTDEIETAEEVVEAIYERRVGKVVKLSSFAAADMPVDEDGLTAQERDLYEDLVDRIGQNKSRVLDILAGAGDVGSPDTEPETAPPGTAPPDQAPADDSADAPSPEDGLAADGDDDTSAPPTEGLLEGAMGGSSDLSGSASGTEADSGTDSQTDDGQAVDRTDPATADAADPDPSPDAVGSEAPSTGPDSDGSSSEADSGSATETTDPETPPDVPPDAPTRAGDGGVDGARSDAEPQAVAAGATGGGSGAEESGTDGEAADPARRTVRITRDVGEILGVDDREYDLVSQDVVTLPSDNADALLQRDAAEPLE